MPIQLTVNITGADQAAGLFEDFNFESVFTPPMWKATLLIQSEMQRYPPPPPNSWYRRTGTLGRRWVSRVKAGNNSVTGTIGNNTIYAPDVQSAADQAHVHRGRWQTDEGVLRDKQGQIVGFFEDALEGYFG